jgi:hypothetical protein
MRDKRPPGRPVDQSRSVPLAGIIARGGRARSR